MMKNYLQRRGLMPSGSFLQADVLCPFYINDSNKPPKIKCEGLSDKSRLALNFVKSDAKNSHIKLFCAGEYQLCPLFRVIYEKYEE